jgi:deoxycytidylate deaminase
VVSDKVEKILVSMALATDSRWRVACVLLRKGRIVVRSTNVFGKTHPVQSRLADRVGQPYRVSLHAELRALLNPKAASCDTLVVGRVNRQGELCLARPCPVCQLAISESGIKRVYYSTDNGMWSELTTRNEVE